MGLVYSALGEKNHALDCCEQALAVSQSIGDKGGEAFALTHIAGVYITLGERMRALDSLKQALPLFHVLGDEIGEANTLRSIATLNS